MISKIGITTNQIRNSGTKEESRRDQIGAERGNKEHAVGAHVKRSALGPLRRLSSELQRKKKEGCFSRKEESKESKREAKQRAEDWTLNEKETETNSVFEVDEITFELSTQNNPFEKCPNQMRIEHTNRNVSGNRTHENQQGNVGTERDARTELLGNENGKGKQRGNVLIKNWFL